MDFHYVKRQVNCLRTILPYIAKLNSLIAHRTNLVILTTLRRPTLHVL